jgi:hypothetical protein
VYRLGIESQELTRVQQRTFRPEVHMQPSQWQMSPECNPSPVLSSAIPSQSQLWEEPPAFDDSLAWGGLPTEPLIMSETGQSMFANGKLWYSHDARQNNLGKTVMDFDGPLSWDWTETNHLHRSNMVPDPEANILLSPVSPYSDAKHTYSPGPDGDQLTPTRGLAGFTMSPPSMKISTSPGFIPSIPQSKIIFPQQPESVPIQSGFVPGMAPARAFHVGNTVESARHATQYGSKNSHEHSQSSSPGMTPWYPPGYTGEKPALLRGSPNQPLATPRLDCHPNSFLESNNRSLQQRQAQWSDRSAGVPAQDYFQSRFMAPSTADADAQRKADDETLLQMKQDGCTYKEIRKALHRKVAESTLRGRYRSLTKPRKERVRRPEWTQIDVSASNFG